MDTKTLGVFKALVDDALKSQSLLLRQTRAGDIISEARKHLTREEFKELEKQVFEKIERSHVIIHYKGIGKLGTRGPF